MIVVLDDLALPVGQVRLRVGGSSAGHKGLQDIIDRLGRDDVPRIRIGIGSPPPQWAGRDYVLSRPAGAELKELAAAAQQAAEAAETWIRRGADVAMSHYNRPRDGDTG